MLSLRLRIACVSASLFTVVACTLPPSPFTPPPSTDATAVDAKAAKEAADGVNVFAAELYAHLRAEDDNLLISPYSINTALAMTASGAQGTTRDEMQKVLHLPAPEKLGPAFHAMTTSVTAPPRSAKHKPELSVANSLWMQKGHPWKKDFLTHAQNDFRAALAEVNFRDSEAVRQRINRWVEKETHNRIKELVPPASISFLTRMVLVNAIYFKAHWAEAFKKENTSPAAFTLLNGRKIQVQTMYQQSAFSLLEDDRLQVLKLPYDGQTTSMYVILPRKADDLSTFEKELTGSNLMQWTQSESKVPPEQVKVWLPKFKFTVPTELAIVLKKMGILEAFSDSANFRGMTDHPEGLRIDRVIHKAFVELDEVGTEAAAATAVVSLAIAPPNLPSPAPVKEFRAVHPFLFVIKHEPTGAVLFIGRVLDPTQ